ncbi:MAG TPA: hypothetical protein VFT66_18835 [Roseiflexaceae bacterium]|nr:hypothetical protein [Roseiflexaceae bacterium]
MQTYGTATIYDLLGDNLAYRSLQPLDERLPGSSELREQLGIPATTPLRKGDEAHARVVAALLEAAQQLRAPGVPLRRLVLVGDTRLSDGGAFMALQDVTGWDGRAFIGSDSADEPAKAFDDDITFANRWSMLHDWASALDGDDFHVDEATVALIDLDKALIGARGRNDRLIDAARLRALTASVADVLGDAFEPDEFEQIFRLLNQGRFEPLTADNQDYVGYLCAIIAGHILPLDYFTTMEQVGRLPRFTDVLPQVAAACARTSWPSSQIQAFHHEVAGLVAAGDPTPFKAFRRREYHETAKLMGTHGDAAPPDELLREELVLTAEIWQVAQRWQEQGALLFGLSDKPDEAALPTDADAARGALPLHRMATHVVGE